MAAKRSIYWVLMAIVAFAILYIYFLPFETHILYGDDLIFYKYNAKLHTFKDWFTCSVRDHKFRSVTSLADGALMHFFNKDLHAYYIFNILVQTGIVLMFTFVADLVLNMLLLSFMAGMLAGTSRFAFYNVTQLFWGGPMEGLAIFIFLGFVYCTLQTFLNNRNTAKQHFTWLLIALLLANLALYTHERYIVLFAFILAVSWLFPYYHKLTNTHKIAISTLAIISVVVNVLIKKYIFTLPFFLGTGGRQIHPDAKSALLYLSQGVLSILQINAGGESMIGISAIRIEHVFQLIIALLGIYMLVLLWRFLANTDSEQRNANPLYPARTVMLFLALLFFLCLAPAIATVRLEQRWLQASFCIFLLMLIVAFTNIKNYKPATHPVSFALFLALFLLSDHNYLHKGAKQMFMSRSANVARTLITAAELDIIKQGATHLYFEEDWWLYTEWVTEQGYLFTCYGKPMPRITFISDLKLDHDSYTPPLPDFHTGDQVLRVKEDTVYDVTYRYLSAAEKGSMGLH